MAPDPPVGAGQRWRAETADMRGNFWTRPPAAGQRAYGDRCSPCRRRHRAILRRWPAHPRAAPTLIYEIDPVIFRTMTRGAWW